MPDATDGGMNKIETPHSLLPPRPDQWKGWGRIKWILCCHSTASLELKLGLGALMRGLFQVFTFSPHEFHWMDFLPLQVWGCIIAVFGFAQVYSCVYRWDKIRSWSAMLLAGTLAYITTKYAMTQPDSIAFILYLPLLVGEVWIAIRGQRLFGGKGMNGDAI